MNNVQAIISRLKALEKHNWDRYGINDRLKGDLIVWEDIQEIIDEFEAKE